MSIPYRIRRNLQHVLVTVFVLVIIAALLLTAWLLWLNRYVVYTEDGAKIDFDLSPTHPTGQLATPPTPSETVNIVYGDPDIPIIEPSTELVQMNGFTISADMLLTNLSGVTQVVSELPWGSSVLLDVKTVRGDYLYSSTLGRTTEAYDTAEVDRLIRTLKDKGCYLIAKLPAFRDYWYFLDDENARVPLGLPRYGGNGALWLDNSGPNYWFNPAASGTLNYLVQVITELRTFGFDEVVLSDFRFPDTDQISFDGDRDETLQDAAKTLVQACASDTFAVSFAGTQIPLPKGRCRLYVENVAAGDIPTFLSGLELEDPVTQLVFLTDLLDTRFEAYSVLRPLDISTEQ